MTKATNERWTFSQAHCHEGEINLHGEVDIEGLDGPSWITFIRGVVGLRGDEMTAMLLEVRGHALAYWRQHADLSDMEPQP